MLQNYLSAARDGMAQSYRAKPTEIRENSLLRRGHDGNCVLLCIGIVLQYPLIGLNVSIVAHQDMEDR